MKIYTKTGDDGTTSLFDGKRVGKDDPRIDLYGDIDELNAMLGVVVSALGKSDLNQVLNQIQKDLFACGAQLANPSHKKQKEKASFKPERAEFLEKTIDQLEAGLPRMTSFILPGGTQAASFLHLARCLCRRTERKLVAFAKKEQVDNLFLIYLNRLSDLLFVMARAANKNANVPDVPWVD